MDIINDIINNKDEYIKILEKKTKPETIRSYFYSIQKYKKYTNKKKLNINDIIDFINVQNNKSSSKVILNGIIKLLITYNLNNII